MAAYFSPVKLSCRCEINLTMVVLLPSRGNELRNELITLEEGGGNMGMQEQPTGRRITMLEAE